MARKKFKMTGFARFFIVLLILAPLAYIGASYYNNEDGIENFKNLFKGKVSNGSNSSTSTDTKPMNELPVSTPSSSSDQGTVEALRKENEQLRKELRQKTDELEAVKEDLNRIKEMLNN